MSHAQVIAARERLVRQVLRLLAAERGDEGDAHYGDELTYAQELVALAAQDLTEATATLDEDDRPVGWDRTDGAS